MATKSKHQMAINDMERFYTVSYTGPEPINANNLPTHTKSNFSTGVVTLAAWASGCFGVIFLLAGQALGTYVLAMGAGAVTVGCCCCRSAIRRHDFKKAVQKADREIDARIEAVKPAGNVQQPPAGGASHVHYHLHNNSVVQQQPAPVYSSQPLPQQQPVYASQPPRQPGYASTPRQTNCQKHGQVGHGCLRNIATSAQKN